MTKALLGGGALVLLLVFVLVGLAATEALAQGGTWETKTPMETQLFGQAAVVLNGIVYEVGGVTNIGYPTPLPEWMGAYDPSTNSWSRKARLNGTAPFPCPSCVLLPPGRADLAAVGTGGKIYAIGGGTGNGLVASTEVYDPALDTWSFKASIPTPRFGLTAQAVNGTIYAIGGSYFLRDNNAYDTANDTWTTKAPMPTGRMGLGSAVVNGLIYVIGGYTDFATVTGTVEAYDPAHDTWTTKASMPTARGYAGVAVVNGIVYVIGGQTSDESSLRTVEAYNPATDTWTTETPMPTSREKLSAAAVGGAIYAVGGATPRWTIYPTNEAFTPAGVPPPPPPGPFIIQPPPFNQPVNSIFPNVQQSLTCLQGNFNPLVPKHLWFYQSKVTGPATINVKAAAVNPAEGGNLIANLFDGATPIGSVTVPYPASGENTGSITIPSAVAGHVYRLEVELGAPASPTQAHHYKVTSSGSLFSVGVNSPTHEYSEHLGQPEAYQVNIGAGENFDFNIFTEFPDFGAPQATAVSVTIRDRSTLTTLSGPTTYSLGAAPASQLVALTNPFPASPGQLVLYVEADGHYRMDKTSGADRGLYYESCSPAPQLTVIKNVTNDNGGLAAPADFSISVTGNSPVPANFPGAPTGTAVNLKAGQYSVTEAGPNGYSPIFSADCAGTIGFGDVKTCTITNDDVPAKITIVKQVINDNGGTQTNFDNVLKLDGVVVGTGTFDHNAGAFSVTEDPVVGYTSAFFGACSGTVNVGDQITCTITNDDIQPARGVATRTQGFWSTHFGLAQQTWVTISPTDRILGSKNMGNGPDNNDVSEMMGGFWSNISKKTDGSARTALDQARMQLLQQLLAAMLNKQAFSTDDNGAIAAGKGAFITTNVSAINSAKNALETYNLSGDNQSLPSSVNAGPASPKTGQNAANKIFWNVLP